MKFSHAWLALAGFAILAVLAGCSLAEDITPPPNYTPQAAQQQPVVETANMFPLVPPNPDQGKELYLEKCMPCHGNTGLGDGPQASKLPNPVAAIGSADLARQSIPSQWFDIITNGNLERFMPGFSASLSDQQRWDILAYVYSFSDTPAVLTTGQALFDQNCSSCHGPTGKGDGEKAANITMQDLSAPSFQAGVSEADMFKVISEGSAPNMPAFQGQIPEDQIWTVTAFIRSLSFVPGTVTVQAATTPGAGYPYPAPESTGTPQPTQQGTPSGTSTETAVGQVTGRVTNGSGGTIPSGLMVKLQGYDNMTVAYEATSPVLSDGTYLFANVPTPQNRVFIASIDTNGTTFHSDVNHSLTGNAPIDLPITIYDTSTDTSKLVADRLHVFFDFSVSGTVQVVELYLVTNPTNSIITPKETDGAVLNYDLPTGATNLQFEDSTLGQRYIATSNGFGDRMNIQPGTAQHQVLFAYDLPYDSKADITIPLAMPVQAAVVMIPNVNVKLNSSQLQKGGTQDVQGTVFNLYNGADLSPSQPLEVTLSGKPRITSQGGLVTQSSSTGLIIGVGLFGVALLLAGLYLVRQRRVAEAAGEFEDIDLPQPASEEDADALMDAIIALDDLYRTGKLPVDAYQARRTELKDKLSKLV